MSAVEMSVERIEALLRGDEPRTAAEERRAALLGVLRAGAPAAPEGLRARALAAVPARRERRFGLSRRRLALAAIPVAAALAVGAALVHGLVSSGSRPNTEALVQRRSAEPARSGTTAASSGNTRALAPHRAASRGKNAFDMAAGKLTQKRSGPLMAAESVRIPKNRLVHADASLEVRVGSHAALSRATNRATQIVSSLGGYAQSVQYQSSRQGYGNAYLALRVPVGKAETAIGRLAALGSLVSQQVSTQDLQQQLTRQTNRVGTLQREIAVYEQAIESGTLSAADRVQIEIRLENARHALTQERKARGRTVVSGATADISLTLTTRQHAAVVPGGGKNSRFDRLLGSAAGFLGLEGIGVLYALVVLSPVLVLGGLGWALVREKRRRDERRLLASA